MAAKVLVCFVDLYPQTLADVQRNAPDAVFVNTSGTEITYWQKLGEFWDKGDDLVILEQDIQLADGCLESFEECPQDWCLYGYPLGSKRLEIFEKGLGLTRFRKRAQAALPYHITHNRADWPGGVPWGNLDMRFYHPLWGRGFRPHVHGVVEHYHDYTRSRIDGNIPQGA